MAPKGTAAPALQPMQPIATFTLGSGHSLSLGGQSSCGNLRGSDQSEQSLSSVQQLNVQRRSAGPSEDQSEVLTEVRGVERLCIGRNSFRDLADNRQVSRNQLEITLADEAGANNHSVVATCTGSNQSFVVSSTEEQTVAIPRDGTWLELKDGDSLSLAGLQGVRVAVSIGQSSSDSNVAGAKRDAAPSLDSEDQRASKRSRGSKFHADGSADDVIGSVAFSASADDVVCSVGLGTLPLGVTYPEPSKVPSEREIADMIHAAATACQPRSLFIDTADTYCEGPKDAHSGERLVAIAIKDLRGPLSAVFASKGGMARINAAANGWRPGNCSAAGIERVIKATVQTFRDGVHDESRPLFLWQLHHVDTLVKAPEKLEAALGSAALAQERGDIRHIGICNTSRDGIRASIKALAAAPGSPVLASVQNEFNFWCRDAELEPHSGAASSSKKGVLPLCAELGIVFIAHSPFGGLKVRRGERSITTSFPELISVAANRACSPHALYLAYLLHRGQRIGAKILLIPGAREKDHAADSVTAARLVLKNEELQILDLGWNRTAPRSRSK